MTAEPAPIRKCPYLDTINRHLLDFDFEKVCSISMSNLNVYACLVCGKYFQGRGKNTHAFTHSVQASHHVFINLHNDRIYCLPDNYEVIDQSLAEIKVALRPSFTPEDITKLDSNQTLSQDVFGVAYLPGFIGLNNLKNTDYVSVALQALAHVSPLRDFFLDPSNYEKDCKSQLVLRFGEIIRKMWSPHNIKNTISPHEILQEISVASKKRFQIGVQNECIDFLSWFLNELHLGLGASKRKKSIITRVFQGNVEVSITTDLKKSNNFDNKQEEDTIIEENTQTLVKTVPFLYLSLDLPPSPLFKDSQGGNVIPQIPLFTVLEKFNGVKITHVLKGGSRERKRYKLKTLPPFIIFHIARFTKNNFFVEKNPTIVNFPIRNLELKEYVDNEYLESLSKDSLQEMSITSLKSLLQKQHISCHGCLDRKDLINKIENELIPLTKYDLIANVRHDSPANKGKEGNMDPLTGGSYRIHVQNRASEQWYEIQDLHVEETMPQLIGLSESYLMIYERKARI